MAAHYVIHHNPTIFPVKTRKCSVPAVKVADASAAAAAVNKDGIGSATVLYGTPTHRLTPTPSLLYHLDSK